MSVADDSDELAFLRFFFEAAGDAFGPADHDIYRLIMESYEDRSGKKVPADYRVGYLSHEDDYEEGYE